MALTYGDPIRLSIGNRRGTTINITGDTSYTTGGYSAPASAFGLGTVEKVDVEVLANSTPAARIADYDFVNSKLRVYDQAFAEIAAAVDLSGFSARVTVIGY